MTLVIMELQHVLLHRMVTCGVIAAVLCYRYSVDQLDLL